MTIKAKEQGRAACLGAAIGLTHPKAGLNLGLAAAASCKEFEHLEFTGGLDPGLAGGGTKQGSPMGWVDLNVGRESVGPQYRLRGHGRTAKSVEAKG
ncbi:MAG: hypothetical protein ACXVCF_15690 [Isosphaeraceae bacterium]